MSSSLGWIEVVHRISCSLDLRVARKVERRKSVDFSQAHELEMHPRSQTEFPWADCGSQSLAVIFF